MKIFRIFQLHVIIASLAVVGCANSGAKPDPKPAPINLVSPPPQVTSGDVQPVDYTSIDSREKLLALYKSGKLVRVYLFPLDAGGAELELNVVYLPPKAAAEKIDIDAKILRSNTGRSGAKYDVSPAYKGKSFVPSRIDIFVSGPQPQKHLVNVW